MATKPELAASVDDLSATVDERMAAAERDRRFVEAVRNALALYFDGGLSLDAVGRAAQRAEARIYSTPCTAIATAAPNENEKREG
jgi:hypothetical protein